MLKDFLPRKTWLAWAMLGAGLLGSVFASLQVKQNIELDTGRQFAFVCDQVTLKIQERLGSYALILRGGAALFAASSAVERKEWRAYVEALRAGENVPGVQGIGFAQVIPTTELATHIARIRGEGFPEYTVSPPGERSIYTAIVYLEPFSGRNLRAFGFDMFSEPVRRTAMEQARDTGEAALSGKVELMQETGADIQAGALMYEPIYRNGAPLDPVGQRRAALVGWVYSPYRMNDLMTDIFRDWIKQESKTIDLHIYDGHEATPAALLFDSNPAKAAHLSSPLDQNQQRIIDFNGHKWLLVFDRTSIPSAARYADAWLVLGYGLVLSGLLFGLIRSLYSTQANAVRIADGLTKEIRQKQELLKESEFRWKFAIEGSGDGLLDWNIADGTVFFSKVWKEMLGFTDDEIGNRLEELQKRIHPEDKAMAFATVQDNLDGKTPNYVNEYRIRCKDGSYKCILDLGMVVSRSEDGKPMRMISTHRDITKRNQAEEELRISEERLNIITSSAQNAIIMVDEAEHISFWNPAAEKIFGYAQEEVIGHDLHTMLIPLSFRDAHLRAFSHFQQTGQGAIVGRTVELTALHKDGSEFPIELSLSAVQMDDAWHAIGIVSDITGRKQAEEQIRKLNEELEIKVQERTRQLLDAQEELVRAEKLAVLGQVAGSVGHELRNPLGVMSNAVYFLQTVLSDTDEITWEYLGIIKEEIAASERIVSDLLDAVRTNPPRPEMIIVSQLIVQSLGKCTIPPSVTVKLDIPAILPPLLVDPMQIRQVFRNLIRNSVEAMPEGGMLEIRALENEAAKNVTISVRDTGIGMTPEQQTKLFQPLFTTKARGIGLGLVVVKNLTEANGGSIEVQSETGRGTVFSVTLPAVYELEILT